MTQEETVTYNKRCAEFIKPSWFDKRRKDYPFPFPVVEIVPAENIIGYGHVSEGEVKHFSGTPDMMKYHSDWNWIMEVVETIENLPIKYVVGINNNNCDIHNVFIKDASFNTYVKNNSLTKKEAVVQAINQFLIWYEQNKLL